MDWCKCLQKRRVITSLYGQGPLTGGRQHIIKIKHLSHDIHVTQPLQPSIRQYNGIIVSIDSECFTDTGVHVATYIEHFQVGAFV